MLNNNATTHELPLEERISFFFSNEQQLHTEGRVLEDISLGNIAQIETFRRELPAAIFAARKVASENFELPEDKFFDGWLVQWVNSLTQREEIIQRISDLGFDNTDPSIFLTFDLRLEKVAGPYAIDIDVRLSSKDQKYNNQLPVVLGFTRVKLLVERDLKG